MKRILLASAAVLAAAIPALAQDDFHWQGQVAKGAAIEIKGVNGGITATGDAGGDVEVTAIKKGRKSDPDSVKVEMVEHAGGVTICAVYPSVDGQENVCAPGRGGRMNTRNNDVSVEFRVKVPQGVRFLGRTVNGGVSVQGVGADSEVETVNGAVEVEAAGTVRANTVNGEIEAKLGRANWDGTLKFSTVNGSVELTMPADLSAEVKASTVNGSIETDFPLSVQGKISRRSLHGTIGAGGRLLEVSTVNGSIELKRVGGAAAAK
jgi:DUF4097 and DUF4098 domain-containing protein YvlB